MPFALADPWMKAGTPGEMQLSEDIHDHAQEENDGSLTKSAVQYSQDLRVAADFIIRMVCGEWRSAGYPIEGMDAANRPADGLVDAAIDADGRSNPELTSLPGPRISQ